MAFQRIFFIVACAFGLGVAPAHVLADHPGVAFGEGPGAAIHTPSATIQSPGRSGLSLRLEYTDLDRFTDGNLERLAEEGNHADSVDAMFVTYLNVAIGVSPSFSLTASMPYVRRKAIRHGNAHGGSAHVHGGGDAVGPGDLALYGSYQVFGGKTWRAAVKAGVKAPTGYTSDRGPDGDRIEAKHQPGSGSWDPLAGLALTHADGTGTLTYHFGALYRHPTEGSRATKLGRWLEYGAAAVYRPGEAHPGHTHGHSDGGVHLEGRWAWIIEVNGLWEGRTEIAGIEQTSTGGNSLLLSPGLRYRFAPSWECFLSLGLPVWQDMHEHGHETEYRVTVGIHAGIP